MPSVLVKDGYRFFFWSNENDEAHHALLEGAWNDYFGAN